MELMDLLNEVNDKKSFIIFVVELAKDRKQNPFEWQNDSIESYLESAKSWLEDSERNEISWKLMDEFLYCGKIYE